MGREKRLCDPLLFVDVGCASDLQECQKHAKTKVPGRIFFINALKSFSMLNSMYLIDQN